MNKLSVIESLERAAAILKAVLNEAELPGNEEWENLLNSGDYNIDDAYWDIHGKIDQLKRIAPES